MKKVLLIAAVAGLAMASCKKDRTCTCVSKSDAPGFVSSTDVTTYKKAKKKDIDEDCVSWEYKTTVPAGNPYYYGEDCTLD